MFSLIIIKEKGNVERKKEMFTEKIHIFGKSNGGIDNGEKTDIMQKEKLHSLIESGGGNGPMKPGNLHFCKVPNPAVVYREMRDLRLIALRLAGRFFCLSGIGSTWTL